MTTALPGWLATEFVLDPDLIYLNHAAVAPWPVRTREAVQRFAQDNAARGAADYMRWLGMEARLRGQLCRLLGAASPDDIALLKNTSEGLSVVAYGLDWQSGDNVVISNEEFPSNRIVWESLARYGVTVRAADLRGTEPPEQALLNLVDERTRLLSISSVQYASGLRLDLQHLGQACRRSGVLFCVDAIQSLGAIPLDVQETAADFLVADGHKWMLGPEGLAVFWCRPELREQLKLHQFGWHMVEHSGDYDRREWQPASSARRFECGSPNMLGIYALSASLSLLEEAGMDTVYSAVLANARYLMDHIRHNTDWKLLTPIDPARHAGIVTFQVPDADHEALHRQLTSRGVVCARRGGGIRFSPHFYTSRDHLTRALECVSSYQSAN